MTGYRTDLPGADDHERDGEGCTCNPRTPDELCTFCLWQQAQADQVRRTENATVRAGTLMDASLRGVMAGVDRAGRSMYPRPVSVSTGPGLVLNEDTFDAARADRELVAALTCLMPGEHPSRHESVAGRIARDAGVGR